MLEVKYTYSGKSFSLKPYITSQEKDFLLASTLGEPSLDDALRICEVHDDVISSLSKSEKIAMLWKLRELSVGDEIHLKFKCVHCNNGNENALRIDEIVEDSKITDERIVDNFNEFSEDNFQDFVNIDLEELEIDEYEKLLEETKNTVTKFNFRKPIICQKCGKTNYYNINKPEFIIDNMSEDSLMSIYQTYNDLNYFGQYTKQDIDSLYPFERTILIGLLNKTREDLTK
jgi:hypothetical protein